MSILATQPEKVERELIKAGTQPAYLYQVIYLGTHEKEFNGKKSQAQKIWVNFELPNEVVEYEDKETKEKKSFVRTIGQEFTLSLSEKGNLLPFIQGWIGRSLTTDELQGFDICSLLGMPAFVTVRHTTNKNNGNTYADIASVSPTMTGFTMPAAHYAAIEISKAEWYGEAFNELPEFLRKKVLDSNEAKLQNNNAPASNLGSEYDEVPTIQIQDMTEVLSA